MKKLRQFLNKLMIGYKCRSIFIKVYLDIDNQKIIRYFFKKGWIKFYIIKDKYILVYLRYLNNKSLFYKVNFISTFGNRQYFGKKRLKYFKRSNAQSALTLLHTSYGVLNMKEAEVLKVGGEIFCVLYE